MPRIRIDLPVAFGFATEVPREVARGKHGIVCFDYDVRKAVPMPPAFRAKAAA